MPVLKLLFGLLVTARAVNRADKNVTMYKVVSGECAQSNVSAEFVSATASLPGLSKGSCPQQGFTEAVGKKTLVLPLLGETTLELFRQPDLLRLAAGMGAQALGLAGTSACCRACQAPSVRLRSVDSAKGHCSETCAPAASVWLLRSLEANLTSAEQGDCAAMGFPAYNTTVTHGIPPLSLSLDVYMPAPAGLVTLSKVVGGICAEATVEEKAAPELAAVAGLERKYCVQQNFTEAAGTKTVEAPMVGTLRMALFRKKGELDVMDALRLSLSLLAGEEVTLYKLGDGKCGQVTLDKKYEAPATKFAGLKEGNCKEQDYTVPAGNQTLNVPVLGKISIALFSRSSPDVLI